MEFGVSTNDDETDFHFDFDQDADVCSYVNTTMQSEDRRSNLSPNHHKGSRHNQDNDPKRSPYDNLDPIREATKESYHADDVSNMQRAHQASNKLEESEESSGYVVDYE